MNQAEFLALGALKSGKVEVLGKQISFRELSVGERGAIVAESSKADGNVPALLVALCVTDEAGNPLFGGDQAAELAKLSPKVVDVIAKAVMRLSGLDSEEGSGSKNA